MPKFKYRAKKGPNEIIGGDIDAENIDSAVNKIIQSGLTPIDVSLGTKRGERVSKKIKRSSFSLFRSVKSQEIALFTRQLSDLISAGVPLLQALNVVHNQTSNPSFKTVIDKLCLFVKDGGTLSEALAQHPNIFSQLYSSMVKSGEISGNLDMILDRLADFTDKDQEIRSKVTSSLVYPALMLIVGILTIFVLLTFVIPRLIVIFEDFSQTLPLPTLILIKISVFFEKFWWLVIAASAVALFYFKRFIKSYSGRLWFDSVKLKIPFLGNFIKDVEIGRFARTLGILLDSGIVIVPALESAFAILDNAIIKEEIKKASQDVAEGEALSIALKGCHHLPEIAMNMISVGEESGHLEQALFKLADSYERQSDRSVKIVTSLLEPLLILFIGTIVGFIVLAMLLPLFKMNLIIK